MGAKTRLTKANSRSESLRTTVPASIVKQFGMKEKDALDWAIDIKGLKLIIEISHIKQERIPIKEKAKKTKGPKIKLLDESKSPKS